MLRRFREWVRWLRAKQGRVAVVAALLAVLLILAFLAVVVAVQLGLLGDWQFLFTTLADWAALLTDLSSLWRTLVGFILAFLGIGGLFRRLGLADSPLGLAFTLLSIVVAGPLIGVAIGDLALAVGHLAPPPQGGPGPAAGPDAGATPGGPDATLAQLLVLAVTVSTFLMVGFLTYVVARECWLSLQPPIEVEAAGAPAGLEFAVANVSGRGLSAGAPLRISPRDVRVDGDPVHLYRFPLPDVHRHLLGQDDALSGRLETDCPLYCRRPAGRPGEPPGAWTTTVDPAGADRRTTIGTEPFPVHTAFVEEVEADVTRRGAPGASRDELDGERVDDLDDDPVDGLDDDPVDGLEDDGDVDQLEDRVEGVIDAYVEQVEAASDRSVDRPDDLMACVFPPVPVGPAAEVQVDLEHVGTVGFARRHDGWACTGVETGADPPGLLGRVAGVLFG